MRMHKASKKEDTQERCLLPLQKKKRGGGGGGGEGQESTSMPALLGYKLP